MFIIVFTAPPTAPVHISVFGVFDMPVVTDIQLAEQGPDHDSLRFKTQRTVPLIMGLLPLPGERAIDPGVPTTEVCLLVSLRGDLPPPP